MKILDVRIENGEMLLLIYDTLKDTEWETGYEEWRTLQEADCLYGEEEINKQMRIYGYIKED